MIVKLGELLDELQSNHGEHFYSQIKDLSVTEIVNAALKDSTKWSHKIDEIVEAALNKDTNKWSLKIDEVKKIKQLLIFVRTLKLQSILMKKIKIIFVRNN